MNGLSQFLVSIFHFRGGKKEQGCGEAEDERIKCLTNNILIFSPSLCPLSTLLPSFSPYINRSPWSNSTSLCMLSLIPLHFNLISSFSLSLLSLFRSMLGMCYVSPLPHIPPSSTPPCRPHPPITMLGRLCTNPLAQQPPLQPCYSEHYSLVPWGWHKTCYQ